MTVKAGITIIKKEKQYQLLKQAQKSHSELGLQRGAIEESQYSLVILRATHVDGLSKNLNKVITNADEIPRLCSE